MQVLNGFAGEIVYLSPNTKSPTHSDIRKDRHDPIKNGNQLVSSDPEISINHNTTGPNDWLNKKRRRLFRKGGMAKAQSQKLRQISRNQELLSSATQKNKSTVMLINKERYVWEAQKACIVYGESTVSNYLFHSHIASYISFAFPAMILGISRWVKSVWQRP